jgi:NAD(P)-dependent dehydrogenase (short-subunit alcohol dehydrogenase family)
MRLEGKAALVTGAGTGIGRAIAREFAREGAKVLVAELDEATGKAAAEELGDARFARCDVSKEGDVQGALDACVDAFGRVDVIVNNAGVSRQDWDTTIAINLSGVYYGCKLAAERMAGQGGGAIVNMASMLGLVGVGAEDAYVAAKHGVVGLTKNFAILYGPRNVRVNCICPGWIETQMTSMIQDAPALREMMEQQTPIQRMGKPEEVAKAALFLASDEASFVNGHALVVDGGWTAR